MKFILALTVAALAIAGCGQKSQDRPANQPPAAAVSPDTKATLEAALQALPGNDSQTAETIDRLNASGAPSDFSKPGNIDVASTRVASLQKALAVEQEAYGKAIREKDNKVHFRADFFDTFVYGYAGYKLVGDANRRRALAGEEKSSSETSVTRTTEGEGAVEGAAEEASKVTTETTTSSSIANLAKSELGSGAGIFRTVELATGVVVAAYATGKAIRTWNNDVVVYFTNTEEIKAHKRNIDRAKDDLDAAQADLKALAASQVAQAQ